MKLIAELITEQYGERCPDRDPECWTCRHWAEYDVAVEMRAERDLLQDILDERPAINAALPESYIRWSQAIYSGDAIRAVALKAHTAEAKKGEGE